MQYRYELQVKDAPIVAVILGGITPPYSQEWHIASVSNSKDALYREVPNDSRFKEYRIHDTTNGKMYPII